MPTQTFILNNKDKKVSQSLIFLFSRFLQKYNMHSHISTEN